MEDRRKIVIPTGADPEETLSRKYFDTQAMRAARPVVPLPETPQGAAAVAPRSGRRWLLPTVVAGAIIIGLGAGFAISVYARRQPPEAPAAVRPVADKPRSVLPWTHTPDEPTAPADDSTTAAADTKDAPAPPQDISKHDPAPQRTGESDDKKREREEAARDARADQRDQRDQQREERVANEREQRKQDRERRRNIGNQNDDLPQDPTNRHTQDGLRRVREIFEGTP